MNRDRPAATAKGSELAQQGPVTPRQAVRELIRYAELGPPSRELPEAFLEFFGPDTPRDQMPSGSGGAVFIEWFLFDRPMRSGDTPARQFAMAAPLLTVEQRRAFFGLAETMPGFFEVVGFSAGGMWLVTFPTLAGRHAGETGAEAIWVEEPAAVRRLSRGDVIWTRLLRWQNRWHLATCCFVLPQSAQALMRPLSAIRPRYSETAWRRLMGQLQPQFFRDLVGDPDDGTALSRPDAVPLDGTERRAYRRLAADRLRRGQLRDALRLYWRVLMDDPRDVQARTEVGRIRWMQGRRGAAERALRSVLADHPADERARAYLAQMLEARGELAEAEPMLRSLVAAGKADASVLFALARVALARGRTDEALRLFRESCGGKRRMKLGLNPAVSRHARAEMQLDAGFDLLDAGMAGAARTHFFQELALPSQPRRIRASAWYGIGRSLLRERRWLDAAGALFEALRLGIDRPKIWAEIGRCYARAGRLEEARAAYAASTLRLPGYVSGLAGLAFIYLRQGSVEAALRTAERACAISPDDPEALSVLGASLLKVGEPDRALPLLERSLRQNPRDIRTRTLYRRTMEAMGRSPRQR